MASAGGGARADEIPQTVAKNEERSPEALGRRGGKRARDPLNGNVSRGFSGVTTFEKKAAIASDGTSKIGGRYLHGTHGDQTLPDANMSRSIISSPGDNLCKKIKCPTRICPFNAQGRCIKGSSCIFHHEIEDPGSDYRWNNEEKAGMLAADAYGKSRGSGEVSQVQCLSNLKVPQFMDLDGSRYHGVDKRSTSTPGVSHKMSSRIDDTLAKKPTTPINEPVPASVVYENIQEPSMDRHSGLTPETYLNGRGTFPKLLDGGILQPIAYKGAYLDVSNSDSKHRYLSFDPLRCYEKFPAYGGTAGNLPITHPIENLSSRAPYTSYSLPGFRNPLHALHATSDHSFASPTFHATSHLGGLSHHRKFVDVGTCTSSPALLPSSSPQPSFVSHGCLSPIKDEVWVTSVPFVPSFDFPDIKTPSRSQYDPFVDYIDSPKDDNKNNLKFSSISSQHKNSHAVTPKSLNHSDKLCRNMSTKGSPDLACLIASNKGQNSSLDDRKPGAASNNEKKKDFRFRLADHVKELIKPFWKDGFLSKDAHKQVVKKSIDKIVSSFEPHQVPTSQEAISNYITISESKIEGLVTEYLRMHVKA